MLLGRSRVTGEGLIIAGEGSIVAVVDLLLLGYFVVGGGSIVAGRDLLLLAAGDLFYLLSLVNFM